MKDPIRYLPQQWVENTLDEVNEYMSFSDFATLEEVQEYMANA